MAELRTTSTMDNRGFVRGVDEMKKEVGGFEKTLGSLKGTLAAAFSVGAATAFARSIAETARELNVAATQTRLTTDQIQALVYAGRDAGAEIDNVRGMMSSMREAMSDATKNGGSMADTMRNLGLDVSKLATMTESQLLEALAKAYKETGNFTELVRVLGEEDLVRTESALVSLAENGFGALVDKAADAGQVMRREVIEAVKELDQRMAELGMRTKSFAASLLIGTEAGEFGKALQDNIRRLLDERGIAGNVTTEQLRSVGPGGAAGLAGTAGRGRIVSQAEMDALRAEARRITEAEFAMRDETARRAAAQRAPAEAVDAFANFAKLTEEAAKRIPAFARADAEVQSDMTGPRRVDRNVADNYERIGGYMGPVANSVASIAQRQLDEQKRTNSILDKIARDYIRANPGPDMFAPQLVGP